MSDSFPSWIARVRNDPLGAAGYNRLIERAKWVERLFLSEHLSTNVGGGIGEHNAAEVPREVGGVYVAAGPSYAFEDFRHARNVTRPVIGEFALELDPNVYTNAAAMTVQVQNTSENGSNVPCLTTFSITDTTEILFFQRLLTSSLGGGNVWAAEDESFVAAIHGEPLVVGAPGLTGLQKTRGTAISELSYDYNGQVQFDSDLRSKYLLDHDSTGKHINREVAQTWANIESDSGGGAVTVLDTSARNPLTATWLGIGEVRLTNTTPWVLGAQPFITTDYARSNGGAVSDIQVACCPKPTITTTTIDVFTYKYDVGTATWDRVDTDFYVVVYAGV